MSSNLNYWHYFTLTMKIFNQPTSFLQNIQVSQIVALFFTKSINETIVNSEELQENFTHCRQFYSQANFMI